MQLMQLMQLRISTILSEWHRDSRGSPTVEFNGLSVCHCQLWQHLFLHMVMGTNHTQSSWSFGGSKEADELDLKGRSKDQMRMFECFWHRNLDGTTIFHLVRINFPGADRLATIWVRGDCTLPKTDSTQMQTRRLCVMLSYTTVCTGLKLVVSLV